MRAAFRAKSAPASSRSTRAEHELRASSAPPARRASRHSRDRRSIDAASASRGTVAAFLDVVHRTAGPELALELARADFEFAELQPFIDRDGP